MNCKKVRPFNTFWRRTAKPEHPPKASGNLSKVFQNADGRKCQEKCLSMIFSISWLPLNQKYQKNTCGIFIIPLFLPQIPKSANMWENISFNPIPNLKKCHIWKSQVKCYFLLHVLFASPYGSSMTFVTIPMHFIPAGLLEFVFCTLCFLNSFSKKGCYKDTFLMWLATYLMMAFRSQSYVSSPSNGTALCDSKVKQYILNLNVSGLSVTLSEIQHSPKPNA